MTTKAILQTAGDGTIIPSGYVGETQTASGSYTGATTAGTTLATLPLTAGVWAVTWSGASVYSSGSVSVLEWNIALTTNVAATPSVTDYYNTPSTNIGFGNSASVTTVQCRGNVSQTTTLVLSASTTYYLRAAMTATGGGSIGLKGSVTAIRIA